MNRKARILKNIRTPKKITIHKKVFNVTIIIVGSIIPLVFLYMEHIGKFGESQQFKIDRMSSCVNDLQHLIDDANKWKESEEDQYITVPKNINKAPTYSPEKDCPFYMMNKQQSDHFILSAMNLISKSDNYFSTITRRMLFTLTDFYQNGPYVGLSVIVKKGTELSYKNKLILGSDVEKLFKFYPYLYSQMNDNIEEYKKSNIFNMFSKHKLSDVLHVSDLVSGRDIELDQNLDDLIKCCQNNEVDLYLVPTIVDKKTKPLSHFKMIKIDSLDYKMGLNKLASGSSFYILAMFVKKTKYHAYDSIKLYFEHAGFCTYVNHIKVRNDWFFTPPGYTLETLHISESMQLKEPIEPDETFRPMQIMWVALNKR